MKHKVNCPRCEQDWLQTIRLVHVGEEGVFCPECDAFWVSRTEPLRSNFIDVVRFLGDRGRPDPEDMAEIEFLGPLLAEL